MLERKLNLSSIAAKIEEVDMSRVKEAIPNYDAIASTVNSATSAVKTVSNDIGSVLGEYCESKKIDKVNKDYLGNLDRLLKLNPELELCDAVAKLNPIESVLLKNTKLPKIKDFSGYVKGAINTELNTLGYVGSIPSCLYDKLLGRISKLSDFGGLSLNKRIDLLGMLGNSCGKDVANGLISSVLETEATKYVIDGLMDSDMGSAYKYIASKGETSYNVVLNALESSISEKEGKNTSSKLLALAKLKKSNPSDTSPGLKVSQSMIDNLDAQNTKSNYPEGDFNYLEESLTMLGGIDGFGVLKGKSSIDSMAKSKLANRKSNDDPNNNIKTTTIDLATGIRLSNLFA